MAHATPAATPICTVGRCDHPSPDGFVCTTCIDRLHRDLRAIAGRDGELGLADELVVTMARQDAPGPSHSIREPGLEPLASDQPIAETALPYCPAAGDVLREMHGVLSTWVRHVVELRYGSALNGAVRDLAYRRAAVPAALRDRAGAVHGPWRRPVGPVLPADDPVELARWLALYRQTIAADPAGGELVDDVARVTARAATVVFPRDWEYMGSCGHCDCPTGACKVCQAPAHPPVEHLYVERGAAVVACPLPPPVCGRSWRTDERRPWLFDQALDTLVTAELAESALPRYLEPELLRQLAARGKRLTAWQVRTWGREGRLVRHKPHPWEPELVDSMGRPVRAHRYKVADVLQVLRQVAQGERG
jgi:hypothetical protein